MDYLTVTQAAEMLGCSPAHVRRLLKADVLHGTKLGPRAWLIRRDALEDYRPKHGGWPRGKKRTTAGPA